VSIQGSYARDTWLSGEADLDIFACFPPTVTREEWIKIILPLLRKQLVSYYVIERYAEHPFLELHAENVRVNIVPCYQVQRGQWKSATDRSPYHTEYMKSHLTPTLRLEARFLRRFMKGLHTYGAEIKIGGFSGMLVETLVLRYGSFMGTLQNASDWTPPIYIDLDTDQISKGEHFTNFNSEFVVIDPVDPNRNLAAAVTPSNLWNFVEASRMFTTSPGLWYFYPPKFKPKTRSEFTRKIANNNFHLNSISFKHPPIVIDVLWGELRRLQKSIIGVLERYDFQVKRSLAWSDEKTASGILLELDSDELPQVVRRKGPAVSNRNGSESFIKRHLQMKDTVRGPWIVDNQWLVDKKRKIWNIYQLFTQAIEDKSYGLILPKDLDSHFRKTWKLRSEKETVSLAQRNKEFNQALWHFIEAKPVWLKANTEKYQ
jgi:tRNA nucleotidyltransferase (CCA-adding enzyme)